MRRYSIYTKDAEIRAIKQGFSWPAFFLQWIWAFFKGLRKIGFVVLLFFIGLVLLEEYLVSIRVSSDLVGGVSLFISLTVSFIMGKRGNEWLESLLTNKEYFYQYQVDAKNKKQAIAAYASGEFDDDNRFMGSSGNSNDEEYVISMVQNLLSMSKESRLNVIQNKLIPDSAGDGGRTTAMCLIAYVKKKELKEGGKYGELFADLGELAASILDAEQATRMMAGDYAFLVPYLDGWRR